jgi:hypothetical protein
MRDDEWIELNRPDSAWPTVTAVALILLGMIIALSLAWFASAPRLHNDTAVHDLTER